MNLGFVVFGRMPRLGRVVRRLWELPCKLMLATIVVCLATREWYPFSLFPMYANFGPTAWYVCVTDETGRPLPTARYLGLDATMLRRAFETRRNARAAAGMAEEAADAAGARDLLELLAREARPKSDRSDGASLPSRIALRRTALRIEAERVARTEDLLAVLGEQ